MEFWSLCKFLHMNPKDIIKFAAREVKHLAAIKYGFGSNNMAGLVVVTAIVMLLLHLDEMHSVYGVLVGIIGESKAHELKGIEGVTLLALVIFYQLASVWAVRKDEHVRSRRKC